MSLAITVNQVGTQNRVSLQLNLGDTVGQVRDEEHEETTAAALGFMNESARLDEDLSEDQAQSIRLSGTSSEGGRKHKKAECVGKRIRTIADEFMEHFEEDPKFRNIVDECTVDAHGNPSTQSAFEHFCDVVKSVFECDENGIARRINLGRIAGVFAYCYYLCKSFILRYALKGVFGFLSMLLGYLAQFLVRTGFYDWLGRIGGWGQLLAMTDRLLPKLPISKRHLVIVADEFMEHFEEDPKFRNIVDECTVDAHGNPSTQSAFEHFCDVVKSVFECDENGIARRINLGRIAGVFAYCYYLCKSFILRYALKGVFGFLSMLLGYLAQFLVRTGFYDWLGRIGGWGQLLAMTDRLLPKLPISKRHLVIGCVVVVFGVLIYRYLRS